MKHNVKDKVKPYEEALLEIRNHYLLGALAERLRVIHIEKMNPNNIILNKNSFGYLTIHDEIESRFYLNKQIKLDKKEWYFIFATILIILGLDLYKKNKELLKENAIFIFAINYVENILNISDLPTAWKNFYEVQKEVSIKNEDSIYEQLLAQPQLIGLINQLNLLNKEESSIILETVKYNYGGRWQKTFSEVFAENLVAQAQKTLALRSSINLSEEELKKRNTLSYKAQRWFINHYPLLSALAAQFDIVEDIKICQRNSIEIAAVSAIEKTIFINPLAGLNEQGMRFIIAHEILHIALNHIGRRQGRDPLIWNLACDFVINHWLVTMNVGIPPNNIYMDRSLNNKSADEIYMLINQDIRLKKKLGTLKNTNAGASNTKNNCDMLDEDVRYFGEFEDTCKEALLRGLFLHESIGRGDIPASLVEEIKAINQPAIPWQVDLARWIAERFPLEESKRTYSRPSRRQSATPDIPRARYIRPQEDKITRTFGVLMDTSASMNRELLGKCLGAIASYSAAQDVKYIRLIFCDAQPYDEGYVPVEILAQKLKVKGRGGTVLQQAVNYLENIEDFPETAPILILTDGFFENDLTIKRDHAFLVPNKAYLPIIPKGEVFEFK